MAWNGIKTFGAEPALSTDMNTYVSDNLEALKNPPSAEGNPDANYTTSATTFGNVDGTDTEGLFKHTLTTTGGDIFVNFVGMVGHNAGATGSILFNVSVDGVDHAADDGITGYYSNTASIIVPISFNYIITGVSAGSHVFRLRWKSSAGANTCTLYAGGGTAGRDVHGQFYVREMS